MWAKDRHHQIISLLSTHGHLSIDALVRDLNVSRETIRRDILELQRVHGGIVGTDQPSEPPFAARMRVNATDKRRIGMAAARLIESGMLCAVDAGTTTLAFAAALARMPDVSVVTNSIDIATSIRAARREADVVLLGGRIGSDVPGTYGELTISEMQRFSPDVAVFSPVAVDAEQGVTNYDIAEAEFARAMIARAGKTILLADHSKIGTTSRVQVCECARIDVLVTDRSCPEEGLRPLQANGIGRIIRA